MCLPVWKVKRIRANIKIKEDQLTLANALYSQLLSDPNSSYRLETGEGAQQAASRKLKDAADAISVLEADINRLYSQLSGGGLTRTTLNRLR